MFTLRRTLVLLLLLSALEQAQLIARAPLPAQDAVECVSVAQRIGDEGLAAAIRNERVAPLFPTTVWLTHSALTAFGLLDPTDWGRAAQIAAALALVAAVVPVFLLARRLVGPDAALVSTLLFSLLPATARLGADGIGDSLHLCLAAWAFWGLIEACEASGRRAMMFALLSGTAIGAALLCRAEVLVLVPLIALAAVRQWKRSGTVRAFAGAVGIIVCFGCGCSTAIVPLVAAGVTEPREIGARLQGGAAASTTRPLNQQDVDHEAGDVTATTVAEPIRHDGVVLEFGRKDRSRSIRVAGIASTCRLYLHEFLQACGYITLPLALVGMWSLGRRMTTGAWLPIFGFVALFLASLFGAVLVLGYVTSRHFMLPVMALLPAAGLGLAVVARWICERSAARASASPPDVAAITRRLAGVVAVGCIAATILPPHHTHAAHRRAADWLRSDAAVAGYVLDQHGWTALSSGRPTYRFDEAETALTDPRLRYVVVERIDLEAASPRGASLRAVLGSAADADVLFADVRGRTAHDVLLFTRSPDEAGALRGAEPIESTSLAVRRNPLHAR